MEDNRLEQYVLGAMMVDSHCIPDVLDRLDVGAFELQMHQYIFSAIVHVYQSTGSAEPVLVAQYLKDNNNLNRIGGIVTITDMVQSIVETSNLSHVVDAVYDRWIKRKIFLVGKKIESLVQQQELSLSEMLAA